MVTIIVRFFIAAVLISTSSLALIAQQTPEFSVERGAVLTLQTHQAESYVIESSANLIDWQTFRVIKGIGQPVDLTAAGNSLNYFRVRAEKYPQLENLSLTQGGNTLKPAFSPSRYAYSFKKESDSVTFELAVGTGVAETQLNGSVVTGTAITAQVNGFAPLELSLKGQNGLVTTYSLTPVPADFPTLLMTNHFAPDPETVILMSPRLPEGAWPMAIDNYGVPLWWKRIGSGLHLRTHENGLLSYTEYTGSNDAGDLLSKNVVLDQHFNELFVVNPVGDFINDPHNIEITTRGTVYLLAFKWNTPPAPQTCMSKTTTSRKFALPTARCSLNGVVGATSLMATPSIPIKPTTPT